MAWTLGSVGTIDFNAASTSHTLEPGEPSGLTTGEAVLLLIACRGTPSVAVAPTGFTLLTSSATGRLQLWGRIATGTGDTPSISVTFATNISCVAQYARFAGAPASMTGISAFTVTESSGPTGANIVTPSGGTPSEDNCLIVYAGSSFDDDGPCTDFPNGSVVIGDDQDAGLSLWAVWGYEVQTTAANVGASQFTATGTGDQNWYSRVVALKAGATTTKYLKVLADSSAASATGVEVVVYGAPAGSNYITGTTRYGSANGQAFEASLESGNAVLKVLASAVGCSGLAASTTVAALARNTTYTTGMVEATIIEE